MNTVFSREDGGQRENTVFTKEYYERDKRHIGNALHIFFSDGAKARTARTFRSDIASGAPKACRCWCGNSKTRWPRTFPEQTASIKALFARKDFESIPVNEFMASLISN